MPAIPTTACVPTPIAARAPMATVVEAATRAAMVIADVRTRATRVVTTVRTRAARIVADMRTRATRVVTSMWTRATHVAADLWRFTKVSTIHMTTAWHVHLWTMAHATAEMRPWGRCTARRTASERR